MNSHDLAANGLSIWRSFCLATEKDVLQQAPTLPGVYVLRRRQTYQRHAGMSDIAYIGSATNANGIRMRLRQYFHPGPTQSTNRRILALCGHSAEFEVAFAPTSSGARAKALEADLLERYEADHNELPPENRRH